MGRGARFRHLLPSGPWLAVLAIATMGCASAATAVPSRPTPDIDATVEVRVRAAVADVAASSIDPAIASVPTHNVDATVEARVRATVAARTPSPTLASAPTPNIDATVEARVKVAVAELPVSAPSPTPTSAPTPNIDATVEARLQAAAADVAASTPSPKPTSAPTPNIDATVEARVQATVEAKPLYTPAPLSTTSVASQVATPTPIPTATPVPIPIQEADVPPTTKSPTVYGVLEVGFEPRGAAGTTAPEPPIDAAFWIESVDGKERIFWITDPDPETGSFARTILDFGLALEPGKYNIIRLIGQHPELADEPISFPRFRVGFGGAFKIASLEFTVPESGCIHIGRMSATFFRVSSGSRAEQERVLDKIGQEIRDTVHYVYLSAGSLVAKSAKNDPISNDEWGEEATRQECVLKFTRWIPQ